MRILDRRLALPPVEERVHHPAHDRPRPDDRDLHDDVVEDLRRVARQRSHLRTAFDLEEADRVRGVQHFVHLRVSRREMREIHVHALMRLDHGQHLLDRAQHPEAEQVHLHDAEVRAVVLVPLDDDAPFHRRGLERHDLRQPAHRHDHPAGVLSEVARQALDAHEELPEVRDARVRGVETGGRHLLREVGRAVAVLAEAPLPEVLRDRVHLLRREAQGLRHLARGRTVAVRDDVRRHRGAVGAVRLVDVLDHLLARVARGQVEVDVGPLPALLREEALEEKLHLDGIHRRDRERVAHGAVRGRAAPLHEDVLALAEVHDVPDDEEVAREVQLRDEVELPLDLRLRLARERPEARPRAFPRDVTEERRRRLARRQRVRGEAVAEVREREGKAPRELGALFEDARQIREEGLHVGRGLQVALAPRVQLRAGRVEVRVVANARERVEEVLVLPLRVARAVRREGRQAREAREIEERAVQVLFLAQEVALQLHVHAPGEERREAVQLAPRRVEAARVARRQRARHDALLTPRQNVQPFRVRGDFLPRRGRLPLRLPRGGGGEKRAEVPVALLVLGEQRQAGIGDSCWEGRRDEA